jgi:hypothetical protein
MRRRALVVTFFVAMALINTYPLILHPGSTIGEHGDAHFRCGGSRGSRIWSR